MGSVLAFSHQRTILIRNDQESVSVTDAHARKRRLPRLDQIRRAVSYDPEAGTFAWLIKVGDAFPAGTPTALAHEGRHRQIRYQGVTYAAAQIAWLLGKHSHPKGNVLCKDGDQDNLRLSNLIDEGARKIAQITADAVREVLDYNPDTGAFTWCSRYNRASRRKDANPTQSKGKRYISVKFGGRVYMAQRIAWLLTYGEMPIGVIEPLNGDQSDLRIQNWAIRRLPTAEKKRRKAVNYKRWREASPDKVRNNNLRLNFNMTVGDYMLLHDAQRGLCAICGKPETAARDGKVQWLSVDHCHVTQNRRQLLCAACNKGLGNFADDPEVLERAAAYLRFHANTTRKEAA